ncbi:MAG: elongation factor P maturation arginine rhamnosyltransferase EarP [Patescibacteria group bacterium]
MVGRKANAAVGGPLASDEVPSPGVRNFSEPHGASLFLQKIPKPGTGISNLEPDTLLASAFCYPSTRAKLRLISEAEPKIRFAEFGNADTETCLPFVRFDEYASVLANFGANVVRGENSAIKAMIAGKPFLWDFYKESNGAHEEKIGDFLDFVRPHFDNGENFVSYADALRAFNSDDLSPEGARKCADVLTGDLDPFERMAETVRKRDLAATVIAELEA